MLSVCYLRPLGMFLEFLLVVNVYLEIPDYQWLQTDGINSITLFLFLFFINNRTWSTIRGWRRRLRISQEQFSCGPAGWPVPGHGSTEKIGLEWCKMQKGDPFESHISKSFDLGGYSFISSDISGDTQNGRLEDVIGFPNGNWRSTFSWCASCFR